MGRESGWFYAVGQARETGKFMKANGGTYIL
jgi:hypothetical protein